MPSLTQPKRSKQYWRSLDDLADSPSFRELVEKEFPSFAPELLRGPTRRQFLKLMGASLAMAGLTGCRWPRENIVPAARQPGNRTPGVPVGYATAFELAGVGVGVLATSFDGRPTKIEGNPQHPFSLGAADHLMQATVLEMYDPDRSRAPRNRKESQAKTWADFDAFAGKHFGELQAGRGAGLVILHEATQSPTFLDLKRRALAGKLPEAKFVEYEPVSYDNVTAGLKLAFGQPHLPVHEFDKTNVIVSFDDDFLFRHPAALRNARLFSRRRRADDGTMSRLYVVESNVSLTGSNADQRHAVRSSEVGAVLCALANELSKHGVALPPAVAQALGELGEAVKADFVAGLARELAVNKGASVITVGPRQAAELHALAAALNEALGNVGKTVSYVEAADRPAHLAGLSDVCSQMRAGKVSTLVILGGNPAYDAPVDLKFGELLSKVETSIHLSLYDNETSKLCSWHAARAHFLESWGDVRAYDGTVSIVQPLIAPLYDGRTPIELLAALNGEPAKTSYELVRRTYGEQFSRGVIGPPMEQAWENALHEGVVPDSALARKNTTVRDGGWAAGLQAVAKGGGGRDGFELVFCPDNKVFDGRFANNGWLQEMPDPLTKLTWDNAALIGPRDAERLGVKQYGDMIRIESGGAGLDIPAYILPGHAEGSITLPLGYARTAAGVVGDGRGFATGALRTSAALHFVGGAKVTGLGKFHWLASTQDHHAIESKVGEDEIQNRLKQIVREGTLEDYKENPAFLKHAVHSLPMLSLFEEHAYTGMKWGMAIDLSACIGCSACVVACQAENNVPVVGKDEVIRGREMHWIRIDRYFKGGRDDPHVQYRHQPLTCQQCENAPCETVCPVAATTHDGDGLNVMVYNRCIGTRYCSNNCPYKVRRFNWFYNHHGPKHPRHKMPMTDVEKMGMNPDVTVRSRGVMEKCTFCVQRINAAKIKFRNENLGDLNAKHIPDATITPACAQSCPTEAIVFGDLNDEHSRVAKLHAHNRAYVLLEDYNNKPRNKFLAKLSNPPAGGQKPGAGAAHHA